MLKSNILSSKSLYRQIFLNAQEEFFKLVDNLKNSCECKECRKCCSLIYLDKTPGEIEQLADSDNEKKLFWQEARNVLIPYGYENSPKWLEMDFDYDLNYNTAKQILPDYIVKVLKFEPKAVFYKCKYADDNECSVVSEKSTFCKDYPFKLLTVLHADCTYNAWQNAVENLIRVDLSQQIYSQVQKIDAYKERFNCNRTGTCCRLSSSEFSYEELLEKAKNKDKFAQQFTSIFLPYKNIDEARKIFPEYVDYILNEIGEDEKVHFYYCPHITEDNLCSIYTTEERPQICADFPNNPLTILYPNCGYRKWKEEINTTAMLSHAMIEIFSYILDKLNEIKTS